MPKYVCNLTLNPIIFEYPPKSSQFTHIPPGVLEINKAIDEKAVEYLIQHEPTVKQMMDDKKFLVASAEAIPWAKMPTSVQRAQEDAWRGEQKDAIDREMNEKMQQLQREAFQRLNRNITPLEAEKLFALETAKERQELLVQMAALQKKVADLETKQPASVATAGDGDQGASEVFAGTTEGKPKRTKITNLKNS